MKYLINILKGAAIGIADAIPGVSGGTLAVIMRVYDLLIGCMSLDFKLIKKEFKSICALGVGILGGIVLASKVLSYLFEVHNVPTQLFFMGVIIGSLPLIFKEANSKNKIRPINIIPFILFMGGMIAFTIVSRGSITATSTPGPIAIVLMTIAAAAAMIMPGLSGALVLKILGGYDLAIRSVSDLDFGTLAFYAIGAVIGLVAAGKIIRFLLDKWHTGTYCAILGLIVGAVPAVFPYGFSFNTEGIIGIVCMLIGFAIPFADFIRQKNKTDGVNEDESE